MIYVMGSAFGSYDKYKMLVEKIKLKESDELYVLGDIVGDTPDTLKLLIEMSMSSNVFPILGDREYSLLKKLTSNDISDFTVKKFNSLDKDSQTGIVEYISDMPLYDELEYNGKKYLLVHAGIKNYSKEKELEEYKLEELIYDSEIPDIDGLELITAHGKKGNNHTSLDCDGTDISIKVIRLDDRMEFAV